jgi:hypothetical protein
MSEGSIDISLGRDEALILFELLGDFSENASLNLDDAVDRLALARLHGALESTLIEPFDPAYDALLHAARERLNAYLSG